jgi:hypothetical protein
MRKRVFRHSTMGLLACLLAVGCNSTPTERERPPASTHLKKIQQAYVQATTSLGRPPGNLEELTPFLKRVGDPAELLRSPDDGENFVIVWGVDVRAAPAGKSFPVIAYEKRGAGGRRYVAGFRQISRMTDEEFRQANFPPGHRPSS